MKRQQAVKHFTAALLLGMLGLTHISAAQSLKFRMEELPERLTVGYAVKTLDMNADGRLDIVVLDSKRLLWLENSSWKVHVIHATPGAANDNVCFDATDIDGDGDLDFALGADWQFNNTRSGGTIGWIEHLDNGWRYHAIAAEPTTHRMRWMEIDGKSPPELVVAPLKGRGTSAPLFNEAGVRLLAFSIPENPVSQPWPMRVINDALHVVHGIDVCDLNRDGKQDLLSASFEGIHWHRRDGGKRPPAHLGSGDQQRGAPQLGSSEVRLGRLADETAVIAAIEPWHGDRVVVYTPQDALDSMWNRHVIDAELAWGHAAAFANLDHDADQELIVGVRDNLSDTHRSGVRIYNPVDAAAGKWDRVLVDPGGVAIEDLAAGDFDGDGQIDIVAVGRKTQNIRIYWNQTDQQN